MRPFRLESRCRIRISLVSSVEPDAIALARNRAGDIAGKVAGIFTSEQFLAAAGKHDRHRIMFWRPDAEMAAVPVSFRAYGITAYEIMIPAGRLVATQNFA
jgi:hypothetical protein